MITLTRDYIKNLHRACIGYNFENIVYRRPNYVNGIMLFDLNAIIGSSVNDVIFKQPLF
jgi:hypothetical protein